MKKTATTLKRTAATTDALQVGNPDNMVSAGSMANNNNLNNTSYYAQNNQAPVFSSDSPDPVPMPSAQPVQATFSPAAVTVNFSKPAETASIRFDDPGVNLTDPSPVKTDVIFSAPVSSSTKIENMAPSMTANSGKNNNLIWLLLVVVAGYFLYTYYKK